MGDRAEKFATLRNLELDSAAVVVPGRALERFTPRSDAPYFDWPSVAELFPWLLSGCQAKRTWPIGESRALLETRWRSLLGTVPRHRAELLRETGSRTVEALHKPLLAAEDQLRPIRVLRADTNPEGHERYGYRSFDRQWIIADNRVVDAPKKDFWRVRGGEQVFLTTLTSTKLGRGPVLTVSPYVPDLHHFSGRGAKNVMPLYRDAAGAANVTDGVLEVLGQALGEAPGAEDLLAAAADFLDRTVAGPLIAAADLPAPTPAQRKPPRRLM